MHADSYLEMQRLVEHYLKGRTAQALQLLEVGSQDVNGSYRPLFECPQWHYLGLDMSPGDNVDVVARHPFHWPLRSRRFDVVVSGQALEHAPRFWQTWREMARVTKPGGLLFLIVPAKGLEHRYPVDCWRFYPDAMAALADLAGLELLQAETRWANTWGDTIGVFRRPQGAPSLLLGAWQRIGESVAEVLGHWHALRQAGGDVQAAAAAAPPRHGAQAVAAVTCDRRTDPLAAPYRAHYNRSVAEWMQYQRAETGSVRTRWMGVATRRSPLELCIYQEILHDVRPRVLLEVTEVRDGGTMFLLQMLDLLDTGMLISVARTPGDALPDHPRLRRVDGDPLDPAVAEQGVARAHAEADGAGPVLVVLGADHAHVAVLRALEHYAPLVTAGSYVIVEDGIVDVMSDLLPGAVSAEGPLAAVMDFLAVHPEFEIDRSREHHLVTDNPCGFLRRRHADPSDKARSHDGEES